MVRKPPVADANYDRMVVHPPEKWAVGLPAIVNSLTYALDEMGARRSLTLLTKMNQKDGFDCMSCAWPDPDHRKVAEFCENGARAVAWEATPVTVPTTFWSEHSVTDLLDKSEYWLGQQGRLIEPVYKAADSDHYVPVSWADAFRIIATKLQSLDSPDQAAFYTSGRAANETAFVASLRH
jgi:formate dehydrogenase major subunit